MSTDNTDLLQALEGMVDGSQAWEIARRYRIHHQHRDTRRPTIEVEMMFIIATDAARTIPASNPRHPDLNVVMATVRWPAP
ncbi:MAG TPA: hypothetical protein VE673_14735 [Pseudonocardiaceae bacterium]|nr:hypothetical protein [Pseudonocardiaceae bacterium]